MYRHLSIKEILDDLDLALPDLSDRCVTSSGVSQAKERLGPEAMRWLFDVSARAWHSEEPDKYLFHGMTLLAMDGTVLRLADSAAIREHFGAQNYPDNKVGSYPQARGVTLTAVPTHLMLDAKFSAYKTSEMELAKELVTSIPGNSLTIFDRGFLSAELLCQLVSGGADRQFLIPAKRNTKWKLIEGSDVDGLVEMETSAPAMKRDPTLPATWRARAIKIPDAKGDIAYLLTSLTDGKRVKAKDLIACYFRRWEIETAYRELKHAMLGSAHTLRSVTVEGVQQEGEVAIDASEGGVPGMHDEEPHHAHGHLHHLVGMRVVHESAGFFHRVFVDKSLPRLDLGLRQAAHSIHAGRQQHAVPVNRGVLG